jgi:uncharacterized OB-fold protein
MPSTQRYWREIPQRYRLEAGKCTKCGKTFFPPRLACDACQGRDFETVTLPNEGTIATFTVIHTPASQFKDLAPFALALVDLADGTRIMCQVADCDPASISIDQKVQIEFRKIQEEGKAGVLCYGYKAVPV